MKNDTGSAEIRAASFENSVNQFGVSVEKSGALSLAEFSDGSRPNGCSVICLSSQAQWLAGEFSSSNVLFKPRAVAVRIDDIYAILTDSLVDFTGCPISGCQFNRTIKRRS